MNKKLKREIQAFFAAPPPVQKEEFLKTLNFPKITYRRFLISQLCYIRKRVWTVSIMILLIGWAAAYLSVPYIQWNSDANKIWIISSILPFLAMFSVTEIYRSTAYRMVELEVSCRYCLSQVVMARITLLGGGNFIILILLWTILHQVTSFSLVQIIVYLMVPYLIVCSVCLLILNHVRGQEGIYGCAAAVCLCCTGNLIFSNIAQFMYTSVYFHGWLMLFPFSCIFIALEIRKFIKEVEERTWNLFLTE